MQRTDPSHVGFKVAVPECAWLEDIGCPPAVETLGHNAYDHHVKLGTSIAVEYHGQLTLHRFLWRKW